MPLRDGVTVVTGGSLTVMDGHLLVPQQRAGPGRGQADLGAGSPPVARAADRPHLEPMPPGQVVAVDGDEAPGADRRVADDVEGAVAVEVAEAQAVVHRGGRRVLDAPRPVHVL